MRTIQKIGIGALIGLVFASGYAARVCSNANQRAMALLRQQATLGQGTQVASTELSTTDVDIRPLQTLYSVLKNLQEHYVEQLTVEDEGKMTYDAMRGMLSSLQDPDTRFLDRDQRKIVSDAREGRFHGIGAILAIRQTWKANKDNPKQPLSDEHLVVTTLLPGGQAEKAGLKPGDEIIAIDGKSVLPFDPYQRVNEMLKDPKVRKMERSQLRKLLEKEQKRIDDGIGVIEAEQRLASPGDKPIELTIAARPPAKESRVTVKPEDTTVETVSPVRMQTASFAYLRVGYFGPATAGQFDTAMKDVESKSAQGIILDLRGATGGDIGAARHVASRFHPDSPLAILLQSRGRKHQLTTENATGWTKPLVILVDHSTTRAPEVLAAGLRESGRAKLVGERTYGELGDSTLIDLADGSSVVMSTGKYVTPKGMDFHGAGVPVDVQASSKEVQMKQAVRLLNEAGGKG